MKSKRHRPPTRRSISCETVSNPAGPNHRVSCSGSVQALNTSSRGAANTRDSTISRSSAQLWRASFGSIARLLLLHPAEVIVEAVEPGLPGPPGVLDPAGDLGQRFHPQPARPALAVLAAR